MADGEGIGLGQILYSKSRQSMHDDGLISIGQFKQLQDHARHAHRVQIFILRVFRLGIPLGDHADDFFARHDFIEQVFGFLPADVERHDRAGEDDNVAPIDDSEMIVFRLKSQGIDAQFHPVAKGGHGDSWYKSLPEVFDFFASHPKK